MRQTKSHDRQCIGLVADAKHIYVHDGQDWTGSLSLHRVAGKIVARAGVSQLAIYQNGFGRPAPRLSGYHQKDHHSELTV